MEKLQLFLFAEDVVVEGILLYRYKTVPIFSMATRQLLSLILEAHGNPVSEIFLLDTGVKVAGSRTVLTGDSVSDARDLN